MGDLNARTGTSDEYITYNINKNDSDILDIILICCGFIGTCTVVALSLYVFCYTRRTWKRLQARVTDAEKALAMERGETQVAHTEIQRVEEKMHYMEKQLTQERQAKEAALTRLSEKISRDLTDNNANIADLSDTNRPTNLVEKFSSLYDDEWTDAFDDLKKIPDYEKDTKVIHELLHILLDCFQICRDVATKQLASGIRLDNSNIVIDPLPTEMKKLVKDKRKKQFDADLPTLQERIHEKFETDRKDVLQSEQVEKYIRRCTEICWLMAIQDPPMAISTEIGEGLKYDKNKYREYLKQGEFVDYVVWPSVLIQDGGALMSKGIVQCCDKKHI